jgi:hypothetical protein
MEGPPCVLLLSHRLSVMPAASESHGCDASSCLPTPVTLSAIGGFTQFPHRLTVFSRLVDGLRRRPRRTGPSTGSSCSRTFPRAPSTSCASTSHGYALPL